MKNIIAKIEKGSALALTLVVVSVASIIFLGIINYIVSQIRYSSHVEARESALHVADAGLNFYKWYLAHAVEGMYMQEIADFWQETDPYPYGVASPYEADFDGIGAYKISVEEPSVGSTVIEIEVIGWTYKKPNVKRTIHATLRPRSWSEYAILANSDIEIEDGEEVNGLVHSNGGIKFDGVCHNEVTSALTDYLYQGSILKDGVWTTKPEEDEVFLGGKRFPAPIKDFDSVLTTFSQIFNAAVDLDFDYSPATKGHQFVLNYDTVSVYRVINTNNGVVTGKQEVSLDKELPDVGAIYVDKNVWVEGTLGSGKKLVIASNQPSVTHANIYISNDIEYEDYVSGTVLGLVAKNDIEVVEGSEDDLRIDAALLAQLGRVGREDYGDTKSKITVFGAIATNQGYGFNGYTTKEIEFDSNLLLNPPPFFPIEGVYRVDFWNEI